MWSENFPVSLVFFLPHTFVACFVKKNVGIQVIHCKLKDIHWAPPPRRLGKVEVNTYFPSEEMRSVYSTHHDSPCTIHIWAPLISSNVLEKLAQSFSSTPLPAPTHAILPLHPLFVVPLP